MTTPIKKDIGLIIKFKNEDDQPSFNNSILKKNLTIDTSASYLESASSFDPLPTTRNSDLYKKSGTIKNERKIN